MGEVDGICPLTPTLVAEQVTAHVVDSRVTASMCRAAEDASVTPLEIMLRRVQVHIYHGDAASFHEWEFRT